MPDVLYIAVTFDGDMARANRRQANKRLSMDLDRSNHRAAGPRLRFSMEGVQTLAALYLLGTRQLPENPIVPPQRLIVLPNSAVLRDSAHHRVRCARYGGSRQSS
jgi:hypothetical protein